MLHPEMRADAHERTQVVRIIHPVHRQNHVQLLIPVALQPFIMRRMFLLSDNQTDLFMVRGLRNLIKLLFGTDVIRQPFFHTMPHQLGELILRFV